MEFGNQIENVMSYSIYKHEATIKMAFEAIFWGVNLLVDPLSLLLASGGGGVAPGGTLVIIV